MTKVIQTYNRPKRLPGIHSAMHQFTLGQTVRLNGHSSGDVYVVTAMLPALGDSPQYRIRNEAEKFERMATEASLELSTGSAENDRETSVVTVAPLIRQRWLFNHVLGISSRPSAR